MLDISWYQDVGHTQETLVSFHLSYFSENRHFDKYTMRYMFLQDKDIRLTLLLLFLIFSEIYEQR